MPSATNSTAKGAGVARSLRVRLTLAMLIPVCLITPLLALYLISSLQEFYGRRLVDDLEAQGNLLADQVQSQPELARNPAALHAWLTRVNLETPARVVIVSRQGIVAAATEPEDQPTVGQPSTDPGVAAALKGQVTEGSRLGENSSADIAYVAIPLAPEAKPLGVIRLSFHLADIESRLTEMRLAVVAGTVAAMLLAVLLGFLLAAALARPLQQLSRLARAVGAGDYAQRASLSGIREVDEVVRSFNQLSASLAQMVQSRKQLLSDITHELGTPLGALRAATEALESGALNEPDLSKQMLVGIDAELARLGRLSQSLNDLSLERIEPRQLHRAPTDLRQILNAAVLRFQPEMEQATITFKCELSDSLPLVAVDPDRITQVINNLLGNARKFTPAHGTVVLRSGYDPKVLWFSVADTGMGIEPEDQMRVFQRFYRTPYAEAIQQGMGLGLAIANEIVRAHGGTIEVKSRRGEGATFTVRIPR